MSFDFLENTILFGSFLGGLAVAFFFLRTIWRLIKIIENRLVVPNMIFLLLIPVLNVVFSLWFFPMVCNSVKKEFQSLGKINFNYPLKFVGIGIPIAIFMSFATLFILESYSLRTLTGIDRAMADILLFFSATGACLLFILFWIGLATYKEKIMMVRKSDKTEGLRFDNSDLLDQ